MKIKECNSSVPRENVINNLGYTAILFYVLGGTKRCIAGFGCTWLNIHYFVFRTLFGNPFGLLPVKIFDEIASNATL